MEAQILERYLLEEFSKACDGMKSGCQRDVDRALFAHERLADFWRSHSGERRGQTKREEDSQGPTLQSQVSSG